MEDLLEIGSQLRQLEPEQTQGLKVNRGEIIQLKDTIQLEEILQFKAQECPHLRLQDRIILLIWHQRKENSQSWKIWNPLETKTASMYCKLIII